MHTKDSGTTVRARVLVNPWITPYKLTGWLASLDLRKPNTRHILNHRTASPYAWCGMLGERRDQLLGKVGFKPWRLKTRFRFINWILGRLSVASTSWEGRHAAWMLSCCLHFVVLFRYLGCKRRFSWWGPLSISCLFVRDGACNNELWSLPSISIIKVQWMQAYVNVYANTNIAIHTSTYTHCDMYQSVHTCVHIHSSGRW